MATVTGSPGTQINVSCTVSDDGQPIDETESAATAQAFADNFATIKSGSFSCTSSPTWTAGTWTFGSGTACNFNGDVSCTKDVTFGSTCSVVFAQQSCIYSIVPIGQIGNSTTLAVLATSHTAPVVVTLVASPTAAAPWIVDGMQVHYSGSAANGEHDFVIEVSNFQAVPWGTATQYNSPGDNVTQSATAAPTMAPSVITSGGFEWVCETSGVSTGAPDNTTPVGSIWADSGGAPVFRNMGASGGATFALVRSGSSAGGTGGGATITAQGQISLAAPPPATGLGRNVTRMLSRWRPDGAKYWTGSVAAPAFGANAPTAIWTVDDIGRFVASADETAFLPHNPQECYWQIGPDDLPQGSQLFSASVYFTPPTGHGGDPGSVPGMSIVAIDIRLASGGGHLILSGATGATPGNVYYPYTSLSAYEGHYLKVTAAVSKNQGYDPGSGSLIQPWERIDHTRYIYLVTFVTEATTNAKSGTIVTGAIVTGVVPFLAQT